MEREDRVKKKDRGIQMSREEKKRGIKRRWKESTCRQRK